MLSRLVQLLVAAFIAVAGGALAWGLTGDHQPLQAAEDPEYVVAGPRVITCYANLTGPQPGCWYLIPTPPGASVPVPGGKQSPGDMASNAVKQTGSDLVAAADQLVATQSGGAWWYDFPVTFAGGETISAHWKSASTQGMAMAALARAYVADAKPQYLAAIKSAVDVMPISADGWPQELPDNSYALSGGLTATLGLWDAWRVTGYQPALDKYHAAVAWLNANLQRYDHDYVVLYALGPHAESAGAFYLKASVAQLTALGLISGNAKFGTVAADWEWRRENAGDFKMMLIFQALARHRLSIAVALVSLLLAVVLALRAVRSLATATPRAARPAPQAE